MITKQILTLDTAVQNAVSLIRNSSHIVAFTGAGISTDSGIPDLSGIDQILSEDSHFHGNVFSLLNSQFATRNPKEFYRLYRKTFFHPEARPNVAHQFLEFLESINKLDGIATMNIDWLHQMAGNKTVYEYWGDMRKNHCIGCQKSYDWMIVRGNSVPHCPDCGQLILPDFVLRNLGTYRDEVFGGQRLIENADLLIIVGTKRSSRSFPSNVPKIIVNEEVSTSQRNGILWIGKNARVVFSRISESYS